MATIMTGYPTDGETFYYHDEPAPLVSIGRVPGAEGTHVLRREDGDGELVQIGGYHLRRAGERWTDFLSVEEG